MRKIYNQAAISVFCMAVGVGAATAQDNAGAFPVIVPTQSSIYNQNSVNLPSAPSVHGQDIVRGASGVTCQSAVGSGGAYVDLGVIGSQDVFQRETAALYGRVVVPLGERPNRPDCTKLYELEVSRLQMEIDLLRMGLPPTAVTAQARPAQAYEPAAIDNKDRPAPEPLVVPATREKPSVNDAPAVAEVPAPVISPAISPVKASASADERDAVPCADYLEITFRSRDRVQ